jgi:hypothetical protein
VSPDATDVVEGDVTDEACDDDEFEELEFVPCWSTAKLNARASSLNKESVPLSCVSRAAEYTLDAFASAERCPLL